MNRKMFVLTEAILALMLIALSFIMFRGKDDEEYKKVAVIIQNSNDNQWAAFKYGLRMAARDYNIEVAVVSTEGILTAEEEMKIIEKEIENGAAGLIVQPVMEEGTKEMIAKCQKKVPVMLIEHLSDAAEAKEPKEKAEALSVTAPDNYAMGRALAEELLKDYNGKLGGKTVGILAETEKSASIRERERGVRDGLKDTGAGIRWFVFDAAAETEKNCLKSQEEVDFVIALDDSSLIAAGECSAANNLRGAIVYGIGSSTEAAYYLDTGITECLIVPDAFNIGYQSLAEIATKIREPFYQLRSQTVSYTAIRRETLFSKENQEILYTMSP